MGNAEGGALSRLADEMNVLLGVQRWRMRDDLVGLSSEGASTSIRWTKTESWLLDSGFLGVCTLLSPHVTGPTGLALL
jgi:hypothetical protein